MSVTRRQVLRLGAQAGLVAAASPLLAACSSDSKAAPTARGSAAAKGDSVKVGYLPITDATPLILAHAKGLYQAEGLTAPDPVMFRSWSAIAEAFSAREVDVAHLLMPMAVQLRVDQKVPLKLVAWNHTNGSALTVGPDIDDVSDLAGTTVAIPFWHSIHNIVLQMIFRDAGLTPTITGEPSRDKGTVRLTVMGPPDMPPALANGAISGYIVADPFNSFAEIQDIGRIMRFTGDVWQDHACCVVVMHEDRVEKDPEWAQAVINGLTAAQDLARHDRQGTAELLGREGEGYLPQPVDVIARALSHFEEHEYEGTGAVQHPQWGNDRIDFRPFPYASYTERLVTEMQNTLVQGDRRFLDELDPSTVHDDLVDDRFVRTVLDEPGRREAFDLDATDTRAEVVDV